MIKASLFLTVSMIKTVNFVPQKSYTTHTHTPAHTHSLLFPQHHRLTSPTDEVVGSIERVVLAVDSNL